jgi:hypothetical protein
MRKIMILIGLLWASTACAGPWSVGELLTADKLNKVTPAYYLEKQFTNLSSAKVAIGTNKATLQYSTDQTVNTLTIPANIELKPVNGAVITVTGGGTTSSNVTTINSFSKILTLPSGQTSAERIVYAGGGHFVMGTEGSAKIYTSSDYGTTWVDHGQLGSETTIYGLIALDAGVILAGTYPNGKLYRSADYGTAWVEITSGFTDSGKSNIRGFTYLGSGVVLMGDTNNSALGQSGKIWKSTTNGATWAQVYNGSSTPDYYQIGSMDHIGNTVIALVGTGGLGANIDSKILRSTDSGATWNIVSSISANNPLTVASNGVGTFLIGCAGSGTSSSHIIRSTDSGATWSDLGNLISGVAIHNGMTFIAGSTWVVGTNGTGSAHAAVWTTSDDGSTWNAVQSLADSTSDDTVYTFALSDTGVLVAGTYKIAGVGKIWKGSITTSPVTTTTGGLTINGSFSAGKYQVFAGTGTVTGLKEVRPEWWGAHPYVNWHDVQIGTVDSTIAVNKAIQTLRLSGGGKFLFGGQYRVTSVNLSSLTYNNDGLILEGLGSEASGFYGTDSTKITVDGLGSCRNTLNNFMIGGVGTIGLFFARPPTPAYPYTNYNVMNNLYFFGNWSIAASVVLGGELNTWNHPRFVNETSPYTGFITSDLNSLGITSPNGAILSDTLLSTNTANWMYGPEFSATHNGSIAVRFIGRASYTFFGGDIVNTSGSATNKVFAQYEVEPDGTHGFIGPVEWYGTLFEGEGIAHYLKGDVGVLNAFYNINMIGGTYNIYGAPLKILDFNSGSGTSMTLGASTFRDTAFYDQTTAPTINVGNVYASTLDISKNTSHSVINLTGDIGNTSTLKASTVNEGSGTNYGYQGISYAAGTPPATGTFLAGHIVWNTAPGTRGLVGWVNTINGSRYWQLLLAFDPNLVYANNAAAITAGVPVNTLYRQGDFLAVVH